MCGICGRLEWGQPAADGVDVLRTMNAAIRHRGPDDEGYFSGPLNGAGEFQGRIGLGMRRLSIIDIAGGHQPIESEDGSVTVVYNGEIYNFRELRSELEGAGHVFKTRSDTEVIVHGYEAWGDDVCRRLNGMFAFALWDERRGRLLLARDRMGIKPLYYAVVGERLVFGSELKSVVQDPSVGRDVDPRAVADFLSLRYVPAPRSIWRGVLKLEPAHLLAWEAGRLEKRRYWRHDPVVGEDRGLSHYLERCDALLGDAVRRQLVAEVPLGTFLSGGLDSTAVTWYAARHKPDLMTFTIWFDDRRRSERELAAACARHLGTRHFERKVVPDLEAVVPELVRIFDEPFGDDSMIPTYFLTKMAREKMTVALSGDGGDELFGGYRTYLADRLAPVYRRVPRWLRRGVVEPVLDGPARRLDPHRAGLFKAFTAAAARPSPLEHYGWREVFRAEDRERLLSPFLKEQLNGHSPAESYVRAWHDAGSREGLERFLYVDQWTHLADEFLVKVDRLSMAHSLEVRPPFLDHELVEFAAEVPMRYKIRGFTTKWLVRRLMAGRLPEAILDAPKKGFGSPIASWFSGPLRPFLQRRLAPDRVRCNPYLDPDEPSRLLAAYLDGRPRLAPRIWTLLMFLEWYEIFVMGRD